MRIPDTDGDNVYIDNSDDGDDDEDGSANGDKIDK